MPLTIVITRDVEDRYRGFLGSVMLEVGPGIYAQPRMSKAVRTRVLEVLSDWYWQLHRGSIVMCWAESSEHGGLGLASLGEPPKQIIKHDAMLLVRRAVAKSPTGGDTL